MQKTPFDILRFSILRELSPDGRLLFSTRMARLFAYGFLAVVLALYLAQAGLSEWQIGLLLTLTLVGDTVISLYITTQADRIGRKRMLIIGALLMVFAGILFALTRNFLLLLLAATIGVISPSGNEVGPFLSIEQASLTQLVPGARRTQIFAWYNLVGSFSTALGALIGGNLVQALQEAGVPALASYQVVVIGYALIGILLGLLFLRLTPEVEVTQTPDRTQVEPPKKNIVGLHRSSRVIYRLAGLFSIDAFAGAFVIQSLVALWFNQKFGVQPGTLGGIFFGANLLAGISALSAAWFAERIGLLNTMILTHLPSNVLLILVPLMPTLPLAILFLLLRFSISQMDVPTRQSYVMAVVAPDERSAASGITGIARTIGASFGPVFTGLLLANPALLSVPFFISGGLKIVYDLILWRSFKAIKPEEEAAPLSSS